MASLVLGTRNVLRVSVPFRILLKEPLAPQGPVDLSRRDAGLLGDRVGEQRNVAAVEKVQNAVVDSPLRTRNS